MYALYKSKEGTSFEGVLLKRSTEWEPVRNGGFNAYFFTKHPGSEWGTHSIPLGKKFVEQNFKETKVLNA